MGGLVFADRNSVGLVHEDVSGLENRVAQKTISIDVSLGKFTELLLISRISL